MIQAPIFGVSRHRSRPLTKSKMIIFLVWFGL